MTKKKRDISGIYYRYKNPETNKIKNWCFEDLPKTEQMEILDISEHLTKDYLKNRIIKLSEVINELSENFDIINEQNKESL